MADLGFKVICCGIDGPAAWAIAASWNAKWDAVRRGQMPDASGQVPSRVYPSNSIGDGYLRFRATGEFQNKKARTKEDWERGWKHIEPIFGDLLPEDVTFEIMSLWYRGDPNNPEIEGVLQRLGVREAHRAMKIWRALWKILVAMSIAKKGDPSLGIRRETPTARDARWSYDEVRKLVKRAWRMNFRGLAAAMCVAWDTQLSPVDVRSLTPAQLKGDAAGPFFALDRTKTGESAIGTLSYKAQRVMRAYLAGLGFDLLQDAPIFRTAGAAPGPKGGRRWQPRPYTKDSLTADFRVVRVAAFGKAEKRKISDFRRSGAVEALAGDVNPAALATKMANTIDKNTNLRKTYLPNDATVVRLADDARAVGRRRLRDQKGNKSQIKG